MLITSYCREVYPLPPANYLQQYIQSVRYRPDIDVNGNRPFVDDVPLNEVIGLVDDGTISKKIRLYGPRSNPDTADHLMKACVQS